MFRISQLNVSDITFGYRFGYPKSFWDFFMTLCLIIYLACTGKTDNVHNAESIQLAQQNLN